MKKIFRINMHISCLFLLAKEVQGKGIFSNELLTQGM